MRSSLPTLILVAYVSLVSAVNLVEEKPFKSDIGKISCTFKMVYQGTIVILKGPNRSKAICKKPKKTINVRNLKITSSSSGNSFIITMTVKKGSTNGILKKVDVELVTKTTTPTTTTSTTTTSTTTTLTTIEQSISSRECALGYSAVCKNNLAENHDEADMKAVCPATHSANGKEDEEEVCSCLPTRAVEQDVAEGISPLGSQHKECVRVPANLLPGDDLDVGKITAMMKDWNIKGAVQEMTVDAGEQEELMSALKKAMEKEMKHSKVLQENISTKFIRSTATSTKIGENYRIMKSLQNATKIVTSSWATSRQSSGQRFQDTCLNLTSLLSPCPSPCNETEPYRSVDGCCNNLNLGDLGSAHKALVRFLDPVYADNIEVPRGGLSSSSLPNARDVSRAVHRTKQVVGNKGASLMVMQFGQFLDHDITLTSEPDSECCDDRLELDVCFNIDSAMDKFFKGKTECLPFSRSDAICSQNGRREQINALSAFVDGSNIYGSDTRIAEGLRTMEGGELRVHELGPTMPTRKDSGFDSGHGQQPTDLVGGDMRAIEQPGLASMHSLFLNEHNRIVRVLRGKSPDLVDEDLYQIARQIVGAELQNIVYSEFLPVVLGEQGMIDFNLRLPEEVSGESVYDLSVVPNIRNEFATAAFRFGHSLIPNHILPDLSPIRTKSNSCPVKDNFFKFEEFILGSDLSGKAWQNMIRGIINQKSPSMDASLNKNILDFLFCGNNCDIQGGFGQDLAARNIQRGRDHGLQSYTKYREFCTLPALTNWADKPAEISQQDWDNFQKEYSSVEDIDLFVGGLAEAASGDGLVGPTFGCIIGKQFELLQKGDRFFFTHKSAGTQNEKGLPVNTKISIRSRTLGDIICDNTDASGTARNVMKISSDTNDKPCSTREPLNFDAIVAELSATSESTTSMTTAPPTITPAILISGGIRAHPGDVLSTLELFVPSTGITKLCNSMTLPGPIRSHTINIIDNKPVICGGIPSIATCIIFTGGKWEEYSKLVPDREGQGSWLASNNDIVLLGGDIGDAKSTSIVPNGGGQSVEGFDLKDNAASSCAINDGDSTILTGGRGASSKVVARYNLVGFVEYLTELNLGRHRHGCGSYRQTDGSLTLVVAAGGGAETSTETLVVLPGNKWTDAATLPRQLASVNFASLNNKFYILGGVFGPRTEILEFDGDEWKKVGDLTEIRSLGAATAVDLEKIEFCK